MSAPTQIYWPGEAGSILVGGNFDGFGDAGLIPFNQINYESAYGGLLPNPGGSLGPSPWLFRNFAATILFTSLVPNSGTFFIVGTDIFGNTISETVAAPTGTNTQTVNMYLSVISIVASDEYSQMNILNALPMQTAYIQTDYNRACWNGAIQVESNAALTYQVLGTVQPINPVHSPGNAGGGPFNDFTDVTGGVIAQQTGAVPPNPDTFQQTILPSPLSAVWAAISESVGDDGEYQTFELTLLQQGLRS